jgi:hypothetical protein
MHHSRKTGHGRHTYEGAEKLQQITGLTPMTHRRSAGKEVSLSDDTRSGLSRRKEYGIANKFAEALEEAISQNSIQTPDQREMLYQIQQLEKNEPPSKANHHDFSPGRQKSSAIPIH